MNTDDPTFCPVRVLYNDAVVAMFPDNAADAGTAVPGRRVSTETRDDQFVYGPAIFRRFEDRYVDGDPMLVVLERSVPNTKVATRDDVIRLCDDLFRELNIEHPDGWTHRSMSVGDVVVVGEIGMAVAECGWESVAVSGDIAEA